jgi:hypothetical protein
VAAVLLSLLAEAPTGKFGRIVDGLPELLGVGCVFPFSQ